LEDIDKSNRKRQNLLERSKMSLTLPEGRLRLLAARSYFFLADRFFFDGSNTGRGGTGAELGVNSTILVRNFLWLPSSKSMTV